MNAIATTAFTSLGAVHLPSASRLLTSSCCPDKDLVILVSRLAGVDRIGLWNSNSGSKIWEIDLGDENSNTHVVDLTWSPDGQSIALIHEPPSVTFHSLQDGHKQLALPINVPSNPHKRACHLTGVWWFRKEKNQSLGIIPDIFKREDVITGSAHSILKMLPLLDNLQEESEKITATDLFAFQGSHTRSSPRSSLPSIISGWPTLSIDATAASIGSFSHKSMDAAGESMDKVDDSNLNSILLVADNLGHLYCFLDGSFPLGMITLGSDLSFTSVIKHPKQPAFFGHLRISMNDRTATNLRPTTVSVPLLGQRKARDLAKLSSTCRELAWYAMRVVKEMRTVWFGSDTMSGARELGPKWVRALETKQKEQFGQEEPNPIMDLTCLLLTGRASESLLDFLGSGEQMSERGIQKWESTLSEALIKLRDYSEKRVAPACQRLHLILEELLGWALLPQQYHLFQLSAEDLNECIALASRAITIASWLAAVARRELSRFREFISWLRFEASAANPANESGITPRHDILEVNHYFMSGLVVSSIDKWFLGPVPRFQPHDLGILDKHTSVLQSVLERARSVATDPAQMAWQTNVTRKDLSHLDRNLDALVQELASRCQRVFTRAAGAACRSAIISFGCDSTGQVPITRHSSQSETNTPIQERITVNETGELNQFFITCMSSGGKGNQLGLARLNFSTEAPGIPFQVGIALLECYFPEEEQEESLLDLELLEAEFLDDECVVIIYRLRGSDSAPYIATVNYSGIRYQDLQINGYEGLPAREDLMGKALAYWREGQLASVRIPIKRRRALVGCRSGGVSVAVNGRAGRRVACVLDGTGTTMESFDLEEDGEDMEVGDDGRSP